MVLDDHLGLPPGLPAAPTDPQALLVEIGSIFDFLSAGASTARTGPATGPCYGRRDGPSAPGWPRHRPPGVQALRPSPPGCRRTTRHACGGCGFATAPSPPPTP